MKTTHRVLFPRFSDDIVSERRTLLYAPLETRDWKSGDTILMYAAPNGIPGKQGVLTSVRSVALDAELDADLGKMCVPGRAEFLAHWDAAHPGMPAASNPLVCRIEFRYTPWRPDPEWSLAV